MTYRTSAPGKDTGDSYFDINKFQQLLSRLEASKANQQKTSGAKPPGAMTQAP